MPARPLDLILTVGQSMAAALRPSTTLLFWAALIAGSLPARAADADRHLLTGVVDSRLDLWEERRRIPIPGMIVSSETFMAVRDVLDAAEPGGHRAVVEVFNVHRTEPVGQLAHDRQDAMTRIALDGVIRSYDASGPAVLASAALSGAASVPGAAFVQATETGGFIVVESIGQRRIPLSGTISHGSSAELSGAGLSDAELLRRFDLVGVISSEDRQIELVMGADERMRSQASDASSPDDEIFDQTRSLASSLRSDLMNSLASPDLRTFLRQDSVSYDGGGASSSALAFVGATFGLDLGQPRWTLKGEYDLSSGEYLDGGLDGYVNHALAADYLYRLTRKDSLSATTYLRDQNDTREQGVIDDFQATASGSYRNRTTGMQLGWQRGAAQARLRYGVTGSVDNSRIDFGQAAANEQQTGTLSANGVYRIRRRVSLLLDGQFRKFDYSGEFAGSSQSRIRGGVDFDFSRRLSGRGLVGYERKRLDGVGGSEGAVVVDADLTWQPRRRSTLTLEAAREFVEVFDRVVAGAQPNAYGLQYSGSLGWQQDWTSRWKSRASLAYRDLDSRNSDAGTTDWQFMASGGYQLNPELTLSAESAYTSSQDASRGDYERWTFTLRLDLVRRQNTAGSGRSAL